MYLWSHFLFALLVGEFFVHLGVLNHWHALAAGLITLAIDIDHVVTAYWHYGELDIKRAWNNAAIHHRFSERTTLHHRGGVIIITAFCALLYFYNFIWFMIAAIGYYSHMLLDQVHNKNIKGMKPIRLNEEGFLIKFTWSELIFDVLVLIGLLWLLYQSQLLS